MIRRIKGKKNKQQVRAVKREIKRVEIETA